MDLDSEDLDDEDNDISNPITAIGIVVMLFIILGIVLFLFHVI